MPTIEENRKYWDSEYSWKNRGEEWSKDWGTVSMQWYGSILPRIHTFLPTGTIIEIGCGYGRWTEYLKDYCSHLIAVDLSEKCVLACRRRFACFPNISCHCNDGMSLWMIDDASIDFVFSFDVLPLVDSYVIDSYLAHLSRVLKEKGIAFLHHSNLGAYPQYEKIRNIPLLGCLLQHIGILEKNLYWRDAGVSADLFLKLVSSHGLKCISQELIRWGIKHVFIDAFSVISKNTTNKTNDSYFRYYNNQFFQETENLSKLSALYIRNE